MASHPEKGQEKARFRPGKATGRASLRPPSCDLEKLYCNVNGPYHNINTPCGDLEKPHMNTLCGDLEKPYCYMSTPGGDLEKPYFNMNTLCGDTEKPYCNVDGSDGNMNMLCSNMGKLQMACQRTSPRRPDTISPKEVLNQSVTYTTYSSFSAL